jgi:hypothetical protein
MRRLWLSAALAGLLALASAAAFSAYLRPGMLVEFANLILCT